MESELPKQYLNLGGKPILVHTVSAFNEIDAIDTIVVVVPENHLASSRSLLKTWNLIDKIAVVQGGKRRQDSVRAGLNEIPDSCNIVLVHDGARPLVNKQLIHRCLEATEKHGAAIAAIPVKDTLKRELKDGIIDTTVDRKNLWQAQTPQGARLNLLLQAFETCGERDVTDEASLLERCNEKVYLVHGSETNLKITRPEDLEIAEKILMQNTAPTIRIGHGFDAHRLTTGRKLVLGGVTVNHHMGLAAHSDGDVVCHALCDALLGALGKGDIGQHFPDSDDQFKDIYSVLLLQQVAQGMAEDGFSITNIDIPIICQKPKLAPHIQSMKTILANTCNCEPEAVNVKATTTETMGYTGRQEGISCHAVASIAKS